MFGIVSNIKLKYYVHCDENLIIHTEKYMTLHTHTHTHTHTQRVKKNCDWKCP